VAYWNDWREVPFNDQLRRSFKMAATTAILVLVSIDYMMNTWVNSHFGFGFH
jgi:hypothetical protein